MKTITKQIVYMMTLVTGISLMGQSSVSRDIILSAGEVSERGISTVSGDITIGKGARVKESTSTVSGDVEAAVKSQIQSVNTVSGDISIGKNATCTSLETVSGDVTLYDGCQVKGTIETVSGDVKANGGCDIFEDISSVSGDIELDDVRLRGNITNVSGDISLYNGSVVEGDIIINRKYELLNGPQSRVKIVIDMNSVVKGSIRVKEKDTNVVVYLSNGGKVRGEIINAEIREQ